MTVFFVLSLPFPHIYLKNLSNSRSIPHRLKGWEAFDGAEEVDEVFGEESIWTSTGLLGEIGDSGKRIFTGSALLEADIGEGDSGKGIFTGSTLLEVDIGEGVAGSVVTGEGVLNGETLEKGSCKSGISKLWAVLDCEYSLKDSELKVLTGEGLVILSCTIGDLGEFLGTSVDVLDVEEVTDSVGDAIRISEEVEPAGDKGGSIIRISEEVEPVGDKGGSIKSGPLSSDGLPVKKSIKKLEIIGKIGNQ